jgi:RND superfamily putative drug exporter
VSHLARIVAGRRSKWLVIAGWIVAVAVLAPLGARLSDVTTDDTAAFLPKGAESTQVQRLLKARFPGGETAVGLIVYRRPGGLTAADRAKIERDAGAVDRAIPVIRPAITPFTPGAPNALVSPRGDAAYTIVTVPLEFRRLADWGEQTRKVVHSGTHGGLQTYVTGDIGLNADFQEVFGSVDTKLLLATVLLVIVLLGAIYRAPLIALIPIIVVALAYQVAGGFIFLYADSGAPVNSQSTSILIVLMFGVGTDYCLLLLSRYREELRRVKDKHIAMQRALRRAGPALLASGCTVIAAMLVLLLADVGSTHALGPVSAIGVGSALLAGLTLLPALLTAAGRHGFWPRTGIVAYDPDVGLVQRGGVWRRVGDRALQRPGLTVGVSVALFALCTLGLLTYKEDYSIGGFFRKDVESVRGFRVLSRSFAAGALSPTAIIIERRGGRVSTADLIAIRRRVTSIPGLAAVIGPRRSKDGRLVRIDVVFRDDPYSDAALHRIDRLRRALRAADPSVRVLVGAGSAVQADFNRAATQDLRLIVPVALLVIGVILGLLLQAVVAPIVLILTVMASFFGTMGLSMFFFIKVVGDRGIDASLPTFAFIFLVALGIDYTIFLMSRVREEARVHGTREGTLRALAATGPVITSAGVILAGTFSVLMTLPVTFAFNIGFMVAVGILLDTFIVRTLMLPAAIELLGDGIWWPSTAQGGGRVLRKHAQPGGRRAPEPAGRC